MSQLDAPTHTYVDQIPLGRRIREIMKEKGSSYSMSAMASRLGMSRETLRVMLSGERGLYTFELEQIAQDLKVPLTRLTQADLMHYHSDKQFSKYISNGQWEESMRAAREHNDVAIGLSERAEATNRLQLVHFWKGELEEATRHCLEFYAMAEEINKKYQDSKILEKALNNLLNCYANMGQFDKALELIELVEPIFRDTPLMGLVYYTLARMELSRYELADAKMYFYKSHEQFLLSKVTDRIGRGYMNIAYIEYVTREYEKAKELFEAVFRTDPSVQIWFLAKKGLAKTLIKLKENRAAEEVIRSALQSDRIVEHLDVKALLLILLFRATGNPGYAEAVVSGMQYNKKERFIASRYLNRYYKGILRLGRSRSARVQRSNSKRLFSLDNNM
ncbi:hypothetical protein CIG75_11150 [Tumebacillus algifaecis]|uniref:HTH cro/C1-type domain-containing protein n=1 Tax=Tumebacillus algifaecis TaxID=1214604 RepID=A0A223D142_9BACL|nr:hypothetical protein [Tumebacillus algifaecis]ASS75479.1 hypothetical protein CIG75_11150 [Tumebacillus algifaecis]